MGHTISPIPTHRPPTRSHCSRQVMFRSPSPLIHPHTSRCSPTRDVHTNNRNDVSLMSVHQPGGRAGLNICANESLDSVRSRRSGRAGKQCPPMPNIQHWSQLRGKSQTPSRRVPKLHLYSSCFLSRILCRPGAFSTPHQQTHSSYSYYVYSPQVNSLRHNGASD